MLHCSLVSGFRGITRTNTGHRTRSCLGSIPSSHMYIYTRAYINMYVYIYIYAVTHCNQRSMLGNCQKNRNGLKMFTRFTRGITRTIQGIGSACLGYIASSHMYIYIYTRIYHQCMYTYIYIYAMTQCNPSSIAKSIEKQTT